MTTLPWYPRDMGKYARDTKTLTLVEHGAYNLLLDHYYSTGPFHVKAMLKQCSSNASLLPDHSRLYILCGALSKIEQDAVDHVIKTYFYLDDDGYYRNRAADEVIAKQLEKHNKRVAAGRKGGAKNNAKQCLSNAKAMQEQSPTDKDIDIIDKNTSLRSVSLSPPYPPENFSDDFEAVWAEYPGRGKDGAKGSAYKGPKATALKSFTKIMRSVREDQRGKLIENIRAGTRRYAEHLDRSGYPSKHTATWLNQRGWEDDYTSTTSPGSGAPGGGKHQRARDILAGDDPAFLEG